MRNSWETEIEGIETPEETVEPLYDHYLEQQTSELSTEETLEHLLETGVIGREEYEQMKQERRQLDAGIERSMGEGEIPTPDKGYDWTQTSPTGNEFQADDPDCEMLKELYELGEMTQEEYEAMVPPEKRQTGHSR